MFKYLKKKHALSFVNDGKIRIATLYEFRLNEKKNLEIFDHDEGKITVYDDNLIFDTAYPESVQKQSKLVKQFLSNTKGVRVTATGATLAIINNSPNLYIYSLSKEYSEITMKKLGYDACIEIINPSYFFLELNEILYYRKLIKQFAVSECIYQSRKMHHSKVKNLHPVWIKDEYFSYQKEIRAVWEPVNEVILPKIIEEKGLKKYVRLHSVLEPNLFV